MESVPDPSQQLNGSDLEDENKTDTFNSGPWSIEEDTMLREAISMFDGHGKRGGINWSRVAEYMQGRRSYQQCKQRWNITLKQGVDTEVNTSPWGPEEDEMLVEAVKEFSGQGSGGRINWSGVAERMGGARSFQQYNVRWNSTLKPRIGGEIKTGPWTPEEDAMLANAVSAFDCRGMRGRVNWVRVAEIMGGTRSAQQCNQRWHATLKLRLIGGLNKGFWTPEEDELLKEAVSEFQSRGANGSVDWIKVSEKIGGKRSSHQCNHRWHDFLKPKMFGNLKQGPWSEEEDELLITAVKLFEGQGQGGKVKWSKVAEHLGNTRSSQQCRYRWNATLKPRCQGDIRSGLWSADEDTLLIEAVRLNQGLGRDGSVDWIKVSEYMNKTRSYVQCRNRWNVIQNPRVSVDNFRNGPWTEEEDNLLIASVQLYEYNNAPVDWYSVSDQLRGSRSFQQCMYRWHELQNRKTQSMP